METNNNERGQEAHIVEGCHLKLKDLKVIARGLKNQYLFKGYIPDYPQPEFHVSRLKHDTNRAGLWGIRRTGGFRRSRDSPLMWFSLDVGPEEIEAAEKRLLETTYPDRTEEQIQSQQSFLEKFATSPAFLKSSRLGSYRFTFSVEEVLEAYKDQFCSRAEPVIRVLRTVLYKKEVMYVVLVHSPANQELYSYHPLLTDVQDYICTYKDGCFLWKSKAMCETHRYELVRKHDEKQLEVKTARSENFYVWDQVAVALHIDDQVLKFDVNQLREKLAFCEKGDVVVKRSNRFDDITTAEKFVKRLWPDFPSPLERA
ncbi:uncharacterized protein LOC141792160 [Halichoeres trimaculatus]|uniref:uncharacterized protein LOC141792160 n=1 Tax=Halichoeres trimaculatus TaxID=147232 RepID=UPI003D9ECDFE